MFNSYWIEVSPGVAGRVPAYEDLESFLELFLLQDRGENFAGIHNIGRKEKRFGCHQVDVSGGSRLRSLKAFRGFQRSKGHGNSRRSRRT